MRTVILTVGPRGAGKSTFCEKVAKAYPEVTFVCRDQIATAMFGDTLMSWDKHAQVKDRVIGIVQEELQRDGAVIILDFWTRNSNERANACADMRRLGADRVEAWHFTTPIDTCEQWFRKRESAAGKNKILRLLHMREYRTFCEMYNSDPTTVREGFEQVRDINPLIDRPEEIFAPR